ncbi:unnamed protein product [Allacma fusca]|uniref:40S ribosomal protein S19-binding protein 1 n=1 Tax=Allacma fusca TaxID=39272 RepID=A0A8J2LU62_9HEXA|nr:unnamed protein product [Allacma fusca]
MSAALVRKALEISSEVEKPKSSKAIKKAKLLKGKKKKTKEQIQKQNIKLLKALDYKSRSGSGSSSKKSKGPKKDKTAFTDEDFAKFEEEYFRRITQPLKLSGVDLRQDIPAVIGFRDYRQRTSKKSSVTIQFSCDHQRWRTEKQN